MSGGTQKPILNWGWSEMKRLLVLITCFFVVFGAGFTCGAYTMYLKQEPQIFAWQTEAWNWHQEAVKNSVAGDYYRQNAELNIYTAEILKEICDNYTAENVILNEQIDVLQYELHKALNPGWEVSN